MKKRKIKNKSPLCSPFEERGKGMKKRKLIIGGIYRHFKGCMAKVLTVGVHTETLDEMVVYVDLSDGRIWIRPKEMFLEKVEKEGKKFYRFELVK